MLRRQCCTTMIFMYSCTHAQQPRTPISLAVVLPTRRSNCLGNVVAIRTRHIVEGAKHVFCFFFFVKSGGTWSYDSMQVACLSKLLVLAYFYFWVEATRATCGPRFKSPLNRIQTKLSSNESIPGVHQLRRRNYLQFVACWGGLSRGQSHRQRCLVAFAQRFFGGFRGC